MTLLRHTVVKTRNAGKERLHFRLCLNLLVRLHSGVALPAQRPRSAAGASNASVGLLQREVGQPLTCHGGLRTLTLLHSACSGEAGRPCRVPDATGK
jgi:hypothetical protein